ncbi:MAG TPA: GNAT family N-acetyltransferase [Pirellulales bacterium]|nr:GNAT family N-acetyltransferase [Pirellulales bacterium]
MLKLSYLRSAEELRKAASQWDALWQRSEVSAPFARAEFAAQWLTHFRPDAAFYGLVVEQRKTFLAALPLVASHSSKWTACGGLPSNAWGLCGDLLLDDAADEAAVLDLLVEGLNEAPWPLLCLAPVAYEAPRWQALLAAARGRGLDAMVVPSQRVGQVQIDGRWDEYQARWSGNHRRHLRKAARRAKQSGKLSLEIHTQPAAQLATLLKHACELEDRSWKGGAGTSILRAPTIFDWYLRQAGSMADLGHLQLMFLKHDDRPIAFEYGCRAKGAYYSTKVGYDAAYAALSPGQLLRAMLLEGFFSSGDVRLVDFWGPLTDATAKWATRDYAVGKVLIAPRRFVSRLALAGYASARPCWRRVRAYLPLRAAKANPK